MEVTLHAELKDRYNTLIQKRRELENAIRKCTTIEQQSLLRADYRHVLDEMETIYEQLIAAKS